MEIPTWRGPLHVRSTNLLSAAHQQGFTDDSVSPSMGHKLPHGREQFENVRQPPPPPVRCWILCNLYPIDPICFHRIYVIFQRLYINFIITLVFLYFFYRLCCDIYIYIYISISISIYIHILCAYIYIHIYSVNTFFFSQYAFSPLDATKSSTSSL